jgi:hypothetical protein
MRRLPSCVRHFGGNAIGRTLPPSKTKLVLAWIEIHREELMANWELAVNGEEVFKIEPLK